jgi:serine/threonine-protein kinase RsbW
MGAANDELLLLPSRTSSLAAARRFVDGWAARAGFSDPAREEISLAVTEAVSNAIRHGSPAGEADHVDLRVQLEGSRLVITVRDHGPSFRPPPPTLPDPSLFAEHGRGLFLMDQLMDDVQFSGDGGTVVRMTREQKS